MAAKLSKLTSADAVREAIAECAQLGRDAFLKKYGFRYSRRYPLKYGGKFYDSKAIVVRCFDTDGTRMLSGASAAAVEFALNGFIKLGSEQLSPLSQVGKTWIASCSVPPNAFRQDGGEAPAELDDGCRVESLGFKRIIRGPSQLIVQHRVEQMKRHGAHLVGEIEPEDDEWVAICDTAGS